MITLQFDDLDDLAEMLWALMAQHLFQAAGSDLEVTPRMWRSMPEPGKEAARSIAREMYEIYGARN